jgi:hypothetical protein
LRHEIHQSLGLLKCQEPRPPIDVHREHFVVVQYFLNGSIYNRDFAPSLLFTEITIHFMSTAPQSHLTHSLGELSELRRTPGEHSGEERREI